MIHENAHRPKQTDGDQTPSAQSPALEEASDIHTQTEQELLSLPEASTLHSNNWGRKKPATHIIIKRREPPPKKSIHNQRVPLGR